MAKLKNFKKDEAASLGIDLGRFANFHYTGSINGMKKLYYGKNALLVKSGSYIYNVPIHIYNTAN